MDAEFDRRWREGSSPFDGLTIALREIIPIEQLRQTLIPVFELLQGHRRDTTLWRLNDWHEHDGCVFEGDPVTWQDLSALLVTHDGLKAACRSDDEVRWGFFPPERDYYLRLYVPTPDQNLFYYPARVDYGLFDLTASQQLTERIAEAVRATSITDLEIIPAKVFFDCTYGGYNQFMPRPCEATFYRFDDD